MQADKSTARKVLPVLVIAAAAWLYGAIHIVYGEGLGLGACWKSGWTFSDTFIDYGPILRGGDGELPWKVGTALERCSLSPDAGAWARDRIILFGVALVVGIYGMTWLARRNVQR